MLKSPRTARRAAGILLLCLVALILLSLAPASWLFGVTTASQSAPTPAVPSPEIIQFNSSTPTLPDQAPSLTAPTPEQLNSPTPIQIIIPSAAPAPEGKIMPSTTQPYYWGALIDGVPFDKFKLTKFEQLTGRPVEVIHWGQPWIRGGTLQDFPQGEFDQVRQHGSIPMLDWGSADSQNGINQPDWQLQKIYEGQYDTFIKNWATAAKAWRHPFFLRFDHEMNGWWFAWSEQMNGNHPGDYVKAWRHVHDIFTQVGATNVTWVWCINVTGNPQLTPADELYPGDAYVDWVAMDGFNWGSDNGSYWQTFYQVFEHTYIELGQLAPAKPLMIGEVASSEKGGPLGSPASKAAWITDAFTKQLPLNFTRVKAILWFDSAGENPEHTWPLESSPAAMDAFRRAATSIPAAPK